MRKRTLNRKLWRDLRKRKGQNLAIAAVIGAGVTVLVMSLVTLRCLTIARSDYYTERRLADIFVHLTRAPDSVAARAAELPGVADVTARVSGSMTLEMPGLDGLASGHVLSLPARADEGLNQLQLLQGRWPDPLRGGEIIASSPFVEAHKLALGDTLNATLKGRRLNLRLVGVGTSPEHLIQVSPGSLFPDERLFGVFWMAEEPLAAATGLKGAFNDLNLELAQGAQEEEVLRRLDNLLAPYGGTGAYGRDLQPSATFIDDEIQGMRTMAIFSPMMFLGVAAFLLAISMRRLLALQREQLATLKAFGYTNLEIGGHYAGMALVIALAGSFAGCLAGTWMAEGLSTMYQTFYRFPVPVFEPGIAPYVIAVSVALFAAMLGVLGGLRQALRLPPAEAMRPAPPAKYRPLLLKRLGFAHRLPVAIRMILREIERRPFRAALTSLGIAFAFSIIILGNFGKDALDFIVDHQFGLAERDDARIALVEPQSRRLLRELESMPGILRAEPFRQVPVRLRVGPVRKQVALIGLEEDGQLVRLLDADERQLSLAGDGCIISRVLAEKLDIRVGGTVRVEVLEGTRPIRELQVSGVVDDFTSAAAYIRITALNRLLREGPVLNGAFLQVDGDHSEDTFTTLGDRPQVTMVTRKKAIISGFLDTIAENLLRMRLFNLVMASIIAIGVVYSSARIALSERGRDLATLRVLGFTRREVAITMLGEFALLTLFALPLGMFLGWGMAWMLLATMDTDLYRIPLVIQPSTWAYAAIVVLGAAVASGLLLLRHIHQIDLISALKVKE